MTEVFPDEDYRFHLRFERGSFADFFHPTAQREKLLAERRHWLQTAPQTHAALLPDGIPLLEETIELGRAEHLLPDEFRSLHSTILQPATCNLQPAASIQPPTPGTRHQSNNLSIHQSIDPTSWRRLVDLGTAWEPDFLLLKPDSTGRIILVGGCVCFPSSWSLAEKMGHPMEMIHGVVPGLNPAIGNQIHGFLTKLRPGVAWLRANWGLTRSAELNQHPERKLPRLDPTVRLDETWLRIERQMLAALPQNHGVLFAIRIATHPLAEIQQNPQIAPRLRRALETMPEPMAQYKGIASARANIISLLRDA